VAPVEREELCNNGEAPRRNESISQLLREGQELLVQVIKDPLGTKGARLTTYVTVPSRHLVLMPSQSNIGISTRIEDDAIRSHLRETMEGLRAELAPEHGFIVRTAAELADEGALRNDVMFLKKLWDTLKENAANCATGQEIHADLPLVLRILRDMVGVELERIRIDSRETWRWSARSSSSPAAISSSTRPRR
jgi:ribonuclease G